MQGGGSGGGASAPQPTRSPSRSTLALHHESVGFLAKVASHGCVALALSSYLCQEPRHSVTAGMAGAGGWTAQHAAQACQHMTPAQGCTR